MGDYVFASFRLGGKLESIDDCEALIDALIEQALVTDNADGRALLKQVIRDQEAIDHDEDQVNYGRFEYIDAAVKKNRSLAVMVSFGRGDGFDGGSYTIYEGEEHGFPDTDTIERRDIMKALDEGGEQAVRDLIQRTHFLQHDCVPPLSGSDVVRGWLSILG